MPFARIEQAVRAIERGEFVVVVDDAERENEGDLIMAAEKATPQSIAFMVRRTSGVIRVALPGARLDDLGIPLMVADNSESHGAAFTVSVDYRWGTTTGISAADRAATVRALTDPMARADDFARPGHIFPLRYREGGVLKRAGHTEASVDLARLAGCSPAGVVSEIVRDDGMVARLRELERFAGRHGLLLVSIADLVQYRRRREKLVQRVSEARLSSRFGDFTAHTYRSLLDGGQHLALIKGEVAEQRHVLVRVQSECVAGDIFGSLRCQCRSDLDLALQRIAHQRRGVVVYLRGLPGRDLAVSHTSVQEFYGLPGDFGWPDPAAVAPSDPLESGVAAQILVELGITTMRLMTNYPGRYRGLSGYGLEIAERIPLASTAEHDGPLVHVPPSVPVSAGL